MVEPFKIICVDDIITTNNGNPSKKATRLQRIQK